MTYNENNTRSYQSSTRYYPITHPLRGGKGVTVIGVESVRELTFDVIGDPKPTPRPRATVAGKHARIYMPKTADDWKHDVRAAAIEAIRLRAARLNDYRHILGEPPMPRLGWELIPPGVAAVVDLEFRLQRPKSHFGTGRNSARLKPSAPRLHTQTPDKDNLEKAVLDALGKFDGMPPLVWGDDCQVIGGNTTKRWTEPGEEPGVSVVIQEVKPC